MTHAVHSCRIDRALAATFSRESSFLRILQSCYRGLKPETAFICAGTEYEFGMNQQIKRSNCTAATGSSRMQTCTRISSGLS